MKKIFYSKNCIFTLILLPIVLAGIFGFGFLTFASGVPASIAIKVQPSINGSVDFPLSQQPVLLVIDSSGNPVSDATIVARASGTGNLNGGSAITDANGLATFSELSYDVTDAFTLTFFYIKNQRIKAVFNKSIQLSPGAVSP
ncbi:MAG: Ig-like domain-containing protein, partial [Candidatus Staskawiczbacteria bacterium]|nr:Ig-like domain-containing protein [Candidatus Staskawiczbacteria bacterium]